MRTEAVVGMAAVAAMAAAVGMAAAVRILVEEERTLAAAEPAWAVMAVRGWAAVTAVAVR
jgi:hypothetical protein